MFLNKEKIKAAIDTGKLSITPFKENNLKSASYTFTLNSTLKNPHNGEETQISKDGYVLSPGEFILGYTEEVLDLKNNFLCLLGTRGSIAQKGIDAVQSSIIAEPDTNSRLILEIVNNSSENILLFPGMNIVKGIFGEV